MTHISSHISGYSIKTKKVIRMTEGRCMKCKKQVEIKDGKERVTANKMRMFMGLCPKCGTKVSRILGKAK